MSRIVAFGNPLMDTVVSIQNRKILKKYQLDQDGQTEVPKQIMKQIYQDIETMDKKCTPGGCAQNTLRVVQWLTGRANEVYMFGAVGNDIEGTLLTELLETDGVTTKYVVQNDFPTGKAISFVYNTHRSLVAHLGAAENLHLEELILQQPDVNVTLHSAQLLYIEGFFLTRREVVIEYILNESSLYEVLVAFNLCGEYICDLVPETVVNVALKSHIIIGNVREFKALSRIMNLKSIDYLLPKLLKNAEKTRKKYGNIVVITNGSKPGVLFYDGGKRIDFPIPAFEDDEYMDTTGAGDAFAAGFLAAFLENRSLDTCCNLGTYAAYEIIKQPGCTIPKKESLFHCNF